MKKLIIGIFFTCICSTSLFLSQTQKDTSSDDLNILSLQNIEALAAGEGMVDFVCYGKGTVDCPNGVKVEIYIGNLSLD